MLFGRGLEKEKEENIWKRKIFFLGGEKNREGKGEQYLEMENIFSVEENKNREGTRPSRKCEICGYLFD